MRTRQLIMVLVLLLAAGAVGACGGSGTSSSRSNASPGERVFKDANCGSCHTLAAAHTTGVIGTKLDGARLSAALVERWVRTGGGGMPAFGAQLSDAQIRSVSQFVASASR